MSLLATLKRETSACHAALDQHTLLRALLAPSLTGPVYTQVLAVFYSFYTPLEAALADHDWQAWDCDFAARRKGPYLAADLADFAVSAASLSLSQQLPQVSTLARAFGALYVLEGSTLGGRIIARHLERSLGVNAQRGARFFSSYVDKVDIMWSQTRASLQHFGSKTDQERDVIDAAQETFAALTHALNSSLHEDAPPCHPQTLI